VPTIIAVVATAIITILPEAAAAGSKRGAAIITRKPSTIRAIARIVRTLDLCIKCLTMYLGRFPLIKKSGKSWRASDSRGSSRPYISQRIVWRSWRVIRKIMNISVSLLGSV
jgi:hypothetical protein